MKNLLIRFTLPVVMLAFTGAAIVTGCEKQDTKLADVNKTITKSAQAELVTSDADFEKVFNESIKMLDDTNHLQVAKADGGYKISVMDGHVDTPAEYVVCPGGQNPGIGFVNCVKKYTLAHGCCTVTYTAASGWNGNSCN